MLRMRNKYCSNCLRTQRFLDLGSYLVCERCSKRLDRLVPAALKPDARIVPWVERVVEAPRREAM
jgi:DNA-directed RNA polymerase subunit RPC12/RpoP